LGEALACQRLGVLQTAQGRLEAGRETLEEGAVVAERAVMRAHCLTRIYAAMARNRLEAGDLAAALTCYRAAYEKFSAANYAYEADRCLDSLAELYQRRDHDGDPDKAQAARSEARQIFRQLGAI
jgi:hypothetical protein